MDPANANLSMLLLAYSVPVRLWLWAVYHLQRRTDWRVVVRLGDAQSDREAAHEERHETKDAAAGRATELTEALRNGRWRPPLREHS